MTYGIHGNMSVDRGCFIAVKQVGCVFFIIGLNIITRQVYRGRGCNGKGMLSSFYFM